MSAAEAQDIMLCAELWLSFGSMVRAYAAAAAENLSSPLQVEAAGDTIRATAGTARLEMTCDCETGAGNWQLTRGQTSVLQGSLQVLPEGRIDINGKTLDLDHAAIDLVASLTTAAANPARDER